MNRKHAREMVRAQISASGLYKVFNILFAVVFFATLLLAVFYNPNAAYEFKWYWLLLCAVAGAGAAFGLSRLFALLPPVSQKAEVITVAAMMAGLLGLQCFVAWSLMPHPGHLDDFGAIFNSAAYYADGAFMPDEYFLYNPTHSGAYVLLSLFFSVFAQFGITSFAVPATVLNILAIDGAVMLLYFCGRRLFGQRRAIFLLALCVLSAPLLLYVPIACAATLALPVVPGIVLLWLKARAAWRQGAMREAVLRFCVLSALAGLGALIKPTVLILWVAAALDMLFLLCGKGRLRLLAAGLAIVLALAVGGSFGLRALPMLPDYDQDDGFPLRGFVMMGLDGVGGYSQEDMDLVLEQDGLRARATFANAEIMTRLDELGFFGVLGHLGKKLAYTFGDGTGEAALVLENNAGRWAPLHELARTSGDYYGLLAYLAFALQAGMLAWVAASGAKSVYRKNDALTFARLALFGLVLFLLVWKTSPAELVVFLPVFLLCGVESSPIRTLAPPRAHVPPPEEPFSQDEINEFLTDYPEPSPQELGGEPPVYYPAPVYQPAAEGPQPPMAEAEALPVAEAEAPWAEEAAVEAAPAEEPPEMAAQPGPMEPAPGDWVSGLGEEYAVADLSQTAEIPQVNEEPAQPAPEDILPMVPAEVEQAEAEQVEVRPAEVMPAEVEQAEAEQVEVEPAEVMPAEVEQAEAEQVEVEPAEVMPAEAEQAEAESIETEPEIVVAEVPAQPVVEQPEVQPWIEPMEAPQPAEQPQVEPMELSPEAQPSVEPMEAQQPAEQLEELPQAEQPEEQPAGLPVEENPEAAEAPAISEAPPVSSWLDENPGDFPVPEAAAFALAEPAAEVEEPDPDDDLPMQPAGPILLPGADEPALPGLIAEIQAQPAVEAEPEPEQPKPEPIAFEPEPIAFEPEPEQPKPEPIASEPEPKQPEPEPITFEPEPEPAPLEPEPAQVPAEPQPEKTMTPQEREKAAAASYVDAILAELKQTPVENRQALSEAQTDALLGKDPELEALLKYAKTRKAPPAPAAPPVAPGVAEQPPQPIEQAPRPAEPQPAVQMPQPEVLAAPAPVAPAAPAAAAAPATAPAQDTALVGEGVAVSYAELWGAEPAAAGQVSIPAEQAGAKGPRGMEVWNHKYNTWQQYDGPVWPSAPGKWEPAPRPHTQPEKPE